MRKFHIPIGWPKRNSKHYRFSIPNSVWNCQLKPTEFVILSYLCCCHAHDSKLEPLSAETVAQAVRMTVGTVKKYLSLLIHKGIVTDEYLLTSAFRCAHNEKFFTLPNGIFLLNLPSSAFMVYAYLLLIEDRKTHTCHPSYTSYRTIAAETGMSINTVIKSMSILLDKGLIAVEYSRYIDQRGMKWKGNNLYTILPIKQAMDSFYQQQLQRLELDTQYKRHRERQATMPENRAEI